MALSQKMLDGYFWHAADFPHFNRMGLIAKRSSYTLTKKNMAEAKAQLRMANKAKNKGLSELVQVMKNCLQKSEVDVASNPEKLKLIGWGPRTEPQPVQLPAQPTDLQPITKENQTVKLKWVRPDDSQPVRNYCIERRQQNGDRISDWTIVQISYNTEITLRNQPLGIQLEYRVRAANNAGTGPFSNTVSVVL
jgi:Fibronectin type III domain.